LSRGFAQLLFERCYGRVRRVVLGDNEQGGLVEVLVADAPVP
jgi:hypothetical protein